MAKVEGRPPMNPPSRLPWRSAIMVVAATQTPPTKNPSSNRMTLFIVCFQGERRQGMSIGGGPEWEKCRGGYHSICNPS